MIPSTPGPAHSLPIDCASIVDATMDALFVHALDGRILHVNLSACTMFGYGRAEFATLTVGQISEDVPPYAQSDAQEKVRLALRNGQHDFPWRSRRKDGSLFWSEVSLRRHDTGGESFILAIVRDIGDRKRIEDALRESEEKFSAIFHGTTNAMAVTELTSGRIVDVNLTWVKTSGISREAALGKTALELGLWIDLAERERYRHEVATTGRIAQREAVLAMAHGNQPTLVSAQTIALSTGSIVLWEFRDMSDLRTSQAATHAGEERLRAIGENFDQGMFYQLISTKDGDRRFTYLSDSVRKLYGATPEEIIADPGLIFRRHHPDDLPRVAQAESEAFDTLSTFRTQLRSFDPSGQIRWSSVVATPKPLPDGTVLWNGVEFTITDLKRAEEERANLEKQLQHSQRLESVGRLAGGVAHDFNNMLGVILGHVELALADLPIDHPVRANLDGIDKAARRSKDLTAQLLAFARKQTIIPRVLDLNTVVASTLKMLQRLIGEDIHLVWRPATLLWSVKMDASQVDQILTNLCVNARDAIAGSGTVSIEIQNVSFDESPSAHPDLPAGDYVRMTVTDDGCGMDRETQGHIFEPFFTTKDVGMGTGLGLSTVYGIARQNGGAVSVYSEPGKGSTFAIYLPRHLDADQPAPETEAIKPPAPGHETILLVEDEPTLLHMIGTMLQRFGYTVLSAGEADEALRLAKKHAADIQLVLTDVIMPGMNGHALAHRIEDILPGVPRLFMSGYTANIISGTGELPAGTGFLQKPFSAVDLTTKVRALLDARRSKANK